MCWKHQHFASRRLHINLLVRFLRCAFAEFFLYQAFWKSLAVLVEGFLAHVNWRVRQQVERIPVEGKKREADIAEVSCISVHQPSDCLAMVCVLRNVAS